MTLLLKQQRPCNYATASIMHMLLIVIIVVKGYHLGRVTARAGGVILSHVEQHTDSLLHGQLTGGAAG